MPSTTIASGKAPFDLATLPASEDDINVEDIYARHPLPPAAGESFPTHVIIDHLPIVPQAKHDKLLAVLKKILKPYTTPVHVAMPAVAGSADGMSKGYAFVECESADAADQVVRALDGYKMDKQHVLTVYRFDEVDRYQDVSDAFEAPEAEEWLPREHLKSWLTDIGARDQFVALRDDEVAVFWNQKQRPTAQAGAASDPPELVHRRSSWTESYVQWSPFGSYLATFHRQGVALWGGESWAKIVRFYHPGVKLAGFSPRESYLVTWSNEPIKLGGAATGVFGPEDAGNQICVWDIRSGRLQRSFPNLDTSSGKMSWPVFKWSPSEQYLARVQPNVGISVYETPSMGLLDKKSLKVDGVVDFEWMPADLDDEEHVEEAKRRRWKDLIAYWTPEVGNQPARVTLCSIPERDIVRTKNLFNVAECKLHWHPRGNYLCVKVDRHTKTKKSIFTNLEIFRLLEREVPVEVVELKDVVIAMAWEPVGDRFCIVTSADATLAQTGGAGAAGGTPRTTVSFYGPDRRPGAKEGTYHLLKHLERKQVNAIFWSPKGRHLVLCTLRSQTVWDVEFWDLDLEPINERTTDKTRPMDQVTEPGAWCQLINTQEHYGLTDLEWDPTGRFVCTSGSAWRQTMENGFAFFDCTGRLLYKRTIEKFKQLLWRPRPHTLLSKDEQRRIRRAIKDYSKEFDAEDQSSLTATTAAAVEQRRRLLQEWKAWRERVQQDLTREREEYGVESDLDDNVQDVEVVEEWVDEVVEETEEIVEA